MFNDNVKPIRKYPTHSQVEELLGTKKFLIMGFTEDNVPFYHVGDLELEQINHLRTFLNIVVDDNYRAFHEMP
jgi:hypothetical protein